jgi:hypothetical protein
MSETFKIQNRVPLRRYLLTTVSAAAFSISFAAAAQNARAEDADHPVLWIEVGGAFDQVSDSTTRWLPPNMTPGISNPPPGPFGKLPSLGYDADLKLSFTPDDSDWIFSAGIRYGRLLRGPKNSHDQTDKLLTFGTDGVVTQYVLAQGNFSNASQRSKASHAILDFQAGKDVGVGLFGQSVLSGGIRIVKLNESAQGNLTALVSAPYVEYNPGEVGHKASFATKHSFDGLGPSISWDASTPIVGTLSGGFSFDWGANAAILFGRQKAKISLHTKDTRYISAANYDNHYVSNSVVLSHLTKSPMRAKEVVVPNVGGFAGLSWHLPNAKISLGYRADFFFGAMDGGIDTAKKENVGFYGPFASVSVGIGG